jgi:hypothetical protein
MNRYVSRVPRRLSSAAAGVAGVLIALCSPTHLLAADRTVLCEDFTNNW